MQVDLNVPSELQARSQSLMQLIQQQIEAGQGAIDFAHYMQLALYTPGLGYYSGGLAKFGQQGDFITAPELSPLFGYCLAQQCKQILAHTAGDILEFGAGSGKLALDILSELADQDALPTNYFILEPSAELQQRQQQLLADKAPRLLPYVSWLNQLPENFSGVVLANEVLDAMPIHLFTFAQHTFYEKCVSWQDGRLVWTQTPILPGTALAESVAGIHRQFGQAWQDYSSEISLLIPAWINSVAKLLTSGVVLLIDYGFPKHEYYHIQRHMGTLMCHYRHQAHGNPLSNPGLQDITSHVDFSLVAESASHAGLEVLGYANQASFLLNTGLIQGLAKHATDEMTHFNLAQGLKKLTLPQEMGELFKVMALGKDYPVELLGFRR
jgi:SAM-dependent MidA family methyltransferase